MSDEARRIVHTFSRNVVVAASAGTGKTHLLTSLYVLSTLGLTSMGKADAREAQGPIPPDRIVATTFSRAAAIEIRARVEAALRALASGERDAPFTAEIAARSATLAAAPTDAELVLRAQRAIDAWPEARIDTLHGLAGDILRRYAIPLGLPPGLRVGEEDELVELSRAAIDEALAAALSGPDDEAGSARALVDACSGFGRVHDAVLPFLDRLDEEGLRPEELGTTDYLAAATHLRRRLDETARACARTARPELADAAAALVRELGTELALPPLARPLLDRLFEIRKPPKANDAELALATLRDEIEAPNHLARARALTATLDEAPLLQARERGILDLLGRIAATITRERTRRAILGFGDLLRLARGRLRDQPVVAREIRDDIDVLLVDEFQDTSRAQRDLVYLLRARERRAGTLPTARDIETHGLFLVGDRKQSIYGFRGADVTVFSAMCADLAGEAAGRALEIPEHLWGHAPSADFVALRESRRSGPAVIDFVNAFSRADFGSIPPDGSEPAILYTEAEQLVAIEPAGLGRVIYAVDGGEPVDDPLLASEGGLREALVGASAAHALVREHGFTARDVALLARRRATIPLIELALTRLGLPYVVAGRALYDTLEVRDLAALIRLVLDPRDRHALAQVLRGPIVGLSDDALLVLSEHRGLSTAILDRSAVDLDRKRFGDERNRLRELGRRFREARPALVRLAPDDALRAVVKQFDLDRIIAALPRAQARLANLDRLASIARQRGGSLQGFSRWLDRQIADETDEAEAVVFSPEDDAMRVTTIHASKGLDFPAVVVFDLDAKPKADPSTLGVVRDGDGPPRLVLSHRGRLGASLGNPARDLARRVARERAAAERRRITYVAITRAKLMLVLIGTPGQAPRDSARAILDSHADSQLAGKLERWDARALLERALAEPVPSAEPIHEAPRPEPRVLPIAAEVALATTPLGVFRDCPRRFSLRFLRGLDEPVGSGQLDLFELDPFEIGRPEASDDPGSPDPRALGRAAHRVLERWPRERFGLAVEASEIAAELEREGLAPGDASRLAADLARFVGGPHGAELASGRVVLCREQEVVLRLDGGERTSLVLRGTIDAYILDREKGLIDLFDYKLARPRPSLDAYAFQLRAYALALARRHPGAAVRAGVVFLLGGQTRWLDPSGARLTPSELAEIERELLATARALAEARATGHYDGIPEPACRALGCGFLTACHRGARSRASR